MLERVPDEFYDWVKTTRETFLKKFAEYEYSTKLVCDTVKSLEGRKAQAIYILKNYPKESGIIFGKLDNKPYQEMIWKMLKPRAEKPFQEDKEQG